MCELNRERDLISPLNSHNNDIEAFKLNYLLSKQNVKQLQENLRKSQEGFR